MVLLLLPGLKFSINSFGKVKSVLKNSSFLFEVLFVPVTVLSYVVVYVQIRGFLHVGCNWCSTYYKGVQ